MLSVLVPPFSHMKYKRNPWREMLNISITLIMVIVSWMFAYAQAHQTVHNKHMQFWGYINCASIKLFFKNKNVCWTRYPDKGYSRAPSY